MSVEDELKKDHANMQSIVDSKQKIIDAQVRMKREKNCTGYSSYYYLSLYFIQIYNHSSQNISQNQQWL